VAVGLGRRSRQAHHVLARVRPPTGRRRAHLQVGFVVIVRGMGQGLLERDTAPTVSPVGGVRHRSAHQQKATAQESIRATSLPVAVHLISLFDGDKPGRAEEP
jgi:hypothetical protein